MSKARPCGKAGTDLPNCAVLAEALFLELTLILAFAVDGLGAHLSIYAPES